MTEEATLLGHIFAQTYNLTKGINKFDDKGLTCALEEVKQLHDIKCFRSIDVNKHKSQECKRAMESLIFLTENHDEIIKGQAYENGIIHQD